jgi:predicted esterase
MRSKAQLAAALLLAWAATAVVANAQTLPPAPASLPKGQLIPKVDAEPGESYALYIPTSYVPGRRSPILYILDARGRAELPAKLFVAGAERYGYFVASSYQSASDGPVAPTLKAMQAMWNDTHRRFAVDDKRIYVAGFSGTVRAACFMGLSVPGSLTGVVGAGAGFPYERQPTAATSFLFFGTIGDRDFNYDEMQALESRLTDLHLPHRIAGFSGTHQWMPEELATAALAWFDLRAMKAGTRAKDSAEVDALWQEDLARARGFEAAGRPIPALRLYSAMADDYAGLRDPAEARQKAAEIAGSPRWKAAVREQEAERKRDQRLLADAERTLAGLTADNGPWSLGKVAGDLRLAELKVRAAPAKEDGEDALAARRVLNALYVQTGFYLPQQAIEHKHYALAAFLVELAAEIRPDDPAIWYTLGSVHARAGLRKKAIEEIQKAADLGWSDAGELTGDPDLESLHGDPAWPGIVETVRRKAKEKG